MTTDSGIHMTNRFGDAVGIANGVRAVSLLTRHLTFPPRGVAPQCEGRSATGDPTNRSTSVG